MSVSRFLAELHSRDIQLWADGERLRCDAPSGVLTPELRDQLRQRKSEILEFLRSAESLARQQKAIVPLQPRGTRAPVFAVLAEQIQAFCAGGECIIAGYCAGGAVALELARVLVRRGMSVSFLALFGCIYPPSYRFLAQIPYWWRRIALHLQVVAKPSSFAGTPPIPWRAPLRAPEGFECRQVAGWNGPAVSSDAFRFEQAHSKVVLKYTPRQFHGRMCLFLPNRAWLRSGDEALRWPEGALGWRSVAPHVEEYYGPDSVDPDRMLVEPDALFIAELFRQYRDANDMELAPRYTPSEALFMQASRQGHDARAKDVQELRGGV